MFWFYSSIKIVVSVEWVPREENEFSDDFSEMWIPDDASLNPAWFSWLDGLWGPQTGDVFAFDNMNHCGKFYSLHWCRGTSGVNTFSCDWSKDTNWVYAPYRAIERAWRTLLSQGAHATMLIPLWDSAKWWHLVAPDRVHLSDKVVD
jgi:hypothetical protein